MLVDKWNQLNYNEKLFEEVYQVLGFRFCQFYETSSFEESSAASSGIGSITLFRCPKILDHRWLPVNGETSMNRWCRAWRSLVKLLNNPMALWRAFPCGSELEEESVFFSKTSSTIRGFLGEAPQYEAFSVSLFTMWQLKNVQTWRYLETYVKG